MDLVLFEYLSFKVFFAHEVSSLSSFCSMWQDEVFHRLLAKGEILIKDALSLDSTDYSDFLSVRASLRKRI
jgi:hypothetical protein